MSYIDTFDHEFIGWFGNRPVYHPLESVAETDGVPEDFGCDPTTLIIGGGSGEWPGIVVADLNELVYRFIETLLSELVEQLVEPSHALQTEFELWQAKTSEIPEAQRWVKHLNYAGWKTNDFDALNDDARSLRFATPLQPNHGTLDRWLAISVGEFVWLAMPDLVPIANDHFRATKDEILRTGDRFLLRNIVLDPPGYPSVLGRKERLGQGVTWGISAWKIDRAVNTLTSRR